MPTFAVVRGGVFIETRFYAEKPPPDKIKHENGVPQLRDYAEVRPTVDPLTEVMDPTPSYEITDDLVTATFTKRDLTAQEIDESKAAAVNGINGPYSPLLKIFYNVDSRLRVLEGDPAITFAQFKSGLKARL